MKPLAIWSIHLFSIVVLSQFFGMQAWAQVTCPTLDSNIATNPNNNYCPKLEGQLLLRCCPAQTVTLTCTYSFPQIVMVTGSQQSNGPGCADCTTNVYTPGPACCQDYQTPVTCTAAVVTEIQHVHVTYQDGTGCCAPPCYVPPSAVPYALPLCSTVSGTGSSCSGYGACSSLPVPNCPSCPGVGPQSPPPVGPIGNPTNPGTPGPQPSPNAPPM